MKQMKHVFAYGALSLLLACADGSSVKPQTTDRPTNFKLVEATSAARGELLEATHVVSLSKDELTARLKDRGVTPRNGIYIYKIQYMTKTPGAASQGIIASGLIIVPDHKPVGYPWISLQHGTIVGKVDAPSVTPSEGIVESSQGFITVVPDYLGFGASSEVLHPYLIEEAYADAGVDMLRAARSFAAKNQLNLGPLFLRGYSEGGYATMALQKALETTYAGEFAIAASAPAAGPYDLITTSKLLLSKPVVNPVNLPFVIFAYDRWLDRGTFDPAQLLAVDVALVAKLFSGAFTSQVVTEQLPSGRDQLLNSSVVNDYLSADPQTADGKQLITWFTAESLQNKNWAPITQTRLYHCKDDEVVPVEVVASTYQSFKALNAASPVLPIVIDSPAGGPAYTHVTCPGIFASLQWFGEILAAQAPAQ